MAGNRDTAPIGAAGAAGQSSWAREGMLLLREMIDETVKVLAPKLKPGDAVAADRRLRAIASAARSIKAVEALNVRPKTSQTAQSEDELDHIDDGDAALGKELRTDLISRLDRLRTQIETDCLAGDVDTPGTDEGQDGSPEPGEPSGEADKALDHLADAGWKGCGQDVRGRLLA